MVRLLPIVFFIGFAATVQSAALPVDSGCDEKDQYWTKTGTYEYTYKATTFGLADSGSRAEVGHEINCKVHLSVLGRCRYALKTSDCEIATEVTHDNKLIGRNPKSDEFDKEMSKDIITFEMTYGHVHDVYVAKDEPLYITNIKRGIITNLQGSRRNDDDGYDDIVTDVQGTCPIRFMKNGNQIVQIKDVNHCMFPSKSDWELSPSSLYWNASFMQPSLHAYSRCDHDLTDETLKGSLCKEGHAVHFDEHTQRAHAHAEITVKMELVNTVQEIDVDTNPMGKRLTGILYEYEDRVAPTEQPENFLQEANKLVDDIVSTTTAGIQKDSNQKLYDLVRLLRKSPDVLEFTQKVAAGGRSSPLENEIALSFVRDALVTCNREPCIKAVGWLALNDHLSENYLTVLLYKLTQIDIKPSYLDTVRDICKKKPSRTCILSLTSMIHTYVKNHPEEARTNPPSAIKETIDYLLKMISDPPGDTPQERVEMTILGLKAIGNLGDIALDTNTAILPQIFKLVSDAHKPHNVSLEAIKSLRRVGKHNKEVYENLMKIIRDQKQHMEHKIVAYLVLTLHYHRKLYSDLANIIDHESTDQLGNFVTMHMTNILLYGDESINQLKQSVRLAVLAHPYTFALQGERPYQTSRHNERVWLYQSPFVQDFARLFGFDIKSSAIYEAYSYLPQHAITNLTTLLLGKKYNTLTLSTSLHGLDPYLEFFFNFRTHGKVETLIDKIKALQEHTDLYSLLRNREEWIPHFDSKIEQKLTQIHDSVIHNYGKQAFAASTSLKRYGDELTYTSWGIIKAKIYSFVENDFQNIDWDANKEYRVHRFSRFIESRHYIPTIAGLPLKWKHNADLLLSLRLDGHFNPFGLLSDPKFLNAKWGIHPSWSLTTENKMGISIPKYTKSGFQVFSTFYRSVDDSGSLSSMMGNTEYRVEVSPRKQHLFHLTHNVYRIQDGEREDIQDRVERTENEDCYSSEYLGLKFCRQKSYTDVSERRPIDIFANNLEYHVWVERADKDLKAYELSVQKESTDNGKVGYKFKFQAPGEKWKREVTGRLSCNDKTKEFNLQVVVPEQPHFKLEASRTQKKDGDKVVGYFTEVNAEIIKGRPIFLHAETTVKSPNELETIVVLKLKDSTYNWKRKFTETANKVELDHHFKYENSNPNSFLHAVLPDILWKDKKTAKVHLHFTSNRNPNQQSVEAYIKSPKSVLEFDYDHLGVWKDNLRHVHINLTRRELPSNEILSFIHLNFDGTLTINEGKVHKNGRLRLAIPHIRWTAELDRKYDSIDNNNYAVLRREKTTDGSIQVTDSSAVDKWEVSLSINHHNVSKARGDVHPTPRERKLDVVLKYPVDGIPQSMTYNVKIINDEGKRNALTSFTTDSTLLCTQSQVKLHGKSDYIRTDKYVNADYNLDAEQPTGAANYNFKLRYDYQLPMEFTQNYKSPRYTFSEVLTVKHSGLGYDVNLEMNADCPSWDFLSYDLKQQFFFHPIENSWEKMEFRHKHMDIDVNGEYKFPIGKYYKKEFNFKSKTPFLPTSNWYILAKDHNYMSVHAEYPDEKRNVYLVSQADSDGRVLDTKIAYDKYGSKKKSIIDWKLRLLKSNIVESNYTVNTLAVKKAAVLYGVRLQKLLQRLDQIIRDPNHAMNKFLQPILKAKTVDEYFAKLGQRTAKSIENIRKSLGDVAMSLLPLIEPLVEFIQRLAKALEPLQGTLGKYLDSAVIQENVESYYRDSVSRLKERIVTLTVVKRSTTSVTFWHPLHWNRISEFPSMTPEAKRYVTAVRATYLNPFPGTRYAVIYGAGNIHTFDGRHYHIEDTRSNDCIYLMAHNFVARQFSLLGQKEKLHLLLPEVAVTFDLKGNVMLNNGKTPETLPISQNGLHVSKQGNNILVKTHKGIELELDVNNLVIVVGISYWNHNKTLGLLGNNDNERKNDFRQLDGGTAHDVEELLTTYELTDDDQCKSANKERKECHGVEAIECSVFNKYNLYSPFFVCSDIVDQSPFLRACEKETQCGGDPCSSLAAYRALCAKHNIHLSLPGRCH